MKLGNLEPLQAKMDAKVIYKTCSRNITNKVPKSKSCEVLCSLIGGATLKDTSNVFLQYPDWKLTTDVVIVGFSDHRSSPLGA